LCRWIGLRNFLRFGSTVGSDAVARIDMLRLRSAAQAVGDDFYFRCVSRKAQGLDCGVSFFFICTLRAASMHGARRPLATAPAHIFDIHWGK
jgi:hypothetical protein